MIRMLIILVVGVLLRMKQLFCGLFFEIELKDVNMVSKFLICFNNWFMLDYILYNVKKVGFNMVVIVIGKENFKFRLYYGEKNFNNDFYGLKILFVIQYIVLDRVKFFGIVDVFQQVID